MMRNIVVLLLFGGMLWNCAQFPTQYERIEADRIRLLDFMYEPPDAAPGDSVTLRAVFAGKPVTADAVTWRVSWKVVKNAMGIDTAFEEEPLRATVTNGNFSERTSCIEVRFVVPENCIEKSPMIPDHWPSLLPEALQTEIPEEFTAMSKQQLLGMVDWITAEGVNVDSAAMARAEEVTPGLTENLPLVAQVFTVPIRIFADVKGSHRIQSDYTVGYSSRLAQWPGVQVFENTNPRIDSVGIYRVEGNGIMRFDREDENTSFTRLSFASEDTTRITVDTGYTYFVTAFTGRYDTVFTLGDMMEGAPPMRTEEHTAEWLFQMPPEETEDLSPNDLMNIGSIGDLDAVLLPPRKSAVRHFTLWVQVTDSKLGVLNRSQGSVLAETHGVFEYTDAYLAQFRK